MATEKTVGEKLEQAKVGLRIAILRVALTSYAEFFPNYFVDNEDESASQLRKAYSLSLKFLAEHESVLPKIRELQMLQTDQITRDQILREQIKKEQHDQTYINSLLRKNISSEPTLPQEVATSTEEIKKFVNALLIAQQASRLEYILSMHDLAQELSERRSAQINRQRLISCEPNNEEKEVNSTQDTTNILSDFVENFPTLRSLKKIRATGLKSTEEKKAREVVDLLAHLQSLTVSPSGVNVSDASLKNLAKRHPDLAKPAATFLAFKNGWARPEAIYLTREQGLDKLDRAVANTPWIFQLLIEHQLSKIKRKICEAEDITMTSQLLKKSIEKMKKKRFLFVKYDSILNCACCNIVRGLLAELCQPYHSTVVRDTVEIAIKNLPQHHRGTSARASSR